MHREKQEVVQAAVLTQHWVWFSVYPPPPQKWLLQAKTALEKGRREDLLRIYRISVGREAECWD